MQPFPFICYLCLTTPINICLTKLPINAFWWTHSCDTWHIRRVVACHRSLDDFATLKAVSRMINSRLVKKAKRLQTKKEHKKSLGQVPISHFHLTTCTITKAHLPDEQVNGLATHFLWWDLTMPGNVPQCLNYYNHTHRCLVPTHAHSLLVTLCSLPPFVHAQLWHPASQRKS